MKRAQNSWKLSNDIMAFERVEKALKSGAFNRTIVIDGDSLTRQLFILLGCIAWSAGYVDEYERPLMKIHKGDTNTILKNAHLHSSSKFINLAHVKLVGSGAIYYVGNPTKEKIVASIIISWRVVPQKRRTLK